MELTLSLVDRASKVCGGDSDLARKLGVHRQVIHELRHGKRTITPETAAELADIAGEDARNAAIAAILERAKGTRREGRLREVLGKAQADGGRETLGISYNEGWSGGNITQQNEKSITAKVNSLYIVCSRNRRGRRKTSPWGCTPYPPPALRAVAIRHSGAPGCLQEVEGLSR